MLRNERAQYGFYEYSNSDDVFQSAPALQSWRYAMPTALPAAL